MDKETVLYIIALIGVAMTIYNWYNGNKKDTQNDTKEFIKLNMKLDQLCETTTKSSTKLDKIDDTISEIRAKQLEHEFRIKELEKKVGD